VYSRKPSSVSTRGSDSPERITLRGSPRSGAVYCGVSSVHQHQVWVADGHATNIKETAAIDTGVSPPFRYVYVFPGARQGSGTVVRRQDHLWCA
jgi:hypothetical protein